MADSTSQQRSWLIFSTALATASLLCHAIQYEPDIPPGPYCATRYRQHQCCTGRQDECSAPILGTLCYCDDFCNRTRNEDCCPDFWSYCKGRPDLPPGNIVRMDCQHGTRNYMHGETFKENCNTCKCSTLGQKPEILCEDYRCLVSQDILDNVNYVEKPLWRARNYSEFWGRTLDDGLKLRLGTMNPQQSVATMSPARRKYNIDDLPKHFDGTVVWARDITPIHDQGWCGASWAISTADVASDRFGIMSKGLEKVELSSQHLLSCNIRGQMGCEGGHLDKAWFFVRRFGLVDEHCYPWVGKRTKCRVHRRGKLAESGCKMRLCYALRNDFFKVGPVYRLVNEYDIMYEIMHFGPVQATLRVYEDFFSYESGIYVHSVLSERHPSAYHSVRIVGWGEEHSPYTGEIVKYWRVANSWGKQWGEDGYFRILRGNNECEIESFVFGVWAKTV